jgi:7,8-dihydropterin-6-yl-methyl-4-(beta-D-ribofuranosyl)aminobenzene 5'-phosphate synthase
MSQATISLLPVEHVEITIIMDCCIDLTLSSTEVAKRIPLERHTFERPQPVAEHGFSALIRVKRGDSSGTVLYDTGLNPRNLLYNVDALEIKLTDIQSVILSHGHADHAMGLAGLAQRMGSRHLPLLLHPGAYLERKLVLPNGEEVSLPPPRKADLLREQIQVIEEVGPSILIEGMILVSGEVARTTSFERGWPIHYARHEQGWEPDPLIHDDQCAIMQVQDKGLVIVTGCGHAGIINIIRNAQALTGVQEIYAVIGGFHLNGPFFEPIIPTVIAALQQIQPRYLVPGHCTGWVATQQIARAMPEAFIATSVGTRVLL